MPVTLDLASLARSLRLPPYALRIADLSALAPDIREREARRLAETPVDLATLRVRVDREGGSLDWLVFAPEPPPQGAGEDLRLAPGVLGRPGAASPARSLRPIRAPLRRRLLELDAETWAELRARAAWEGIAPAAMVLAALADGLAAWSREPQFTVELSLAGTPALGPAGARRRRSRTLRRAGASRPGTPPPRPRLAAAAVGAARGLARGCRSP